MLGSALGLPSVCAPSPPSLPPAPHLPSAATEQWGVLALNAMQRQPLSPDCCGFLSLHPPPRPTRKGLREDGGEELPPLLWE